MNPPHALSADANKYPASVARAKQRRRPGADERQRLLLKACLAPQDDALAAWCEWVSRSNPDLEDAASMELATYAAALFVDRAGDGSNERRCRSLSRRTWYASQLALDAAYRIGTACRRFGIQAIAAGDLATYLAGHQFAGQPFAVRSVDIEVPITARSCIPVLLEAALHGAAREAMQSLRLLVSIRPVDCPNGWMDSLHQAAVPPGKHDEWTIYVRDPASRIIELATTNCSSTPPGRLRWILELVTIANDFASPQLAPAVAAAALSLKGVAEARHVLPLIAGLPGGEVVEPLSAAVSTLPVRARSRCRVWLRNQPPHSLLRRLFGLYGRVTRRWWRHWF